MIIKKEVIPGTSRIRCTFDSGSVRESQIIYLTEAQWKNASILTHLYGERTSEVIGKLLDKAVETLKAV